MPRDDRHAAKKQSGKSVRRRLRVAATADSSLPRSPGDTRAPVEECAAWVGLRSQSVQPPPEFVAQLLGAHPRRRPRSHQQLALNYRLEDEPIAIARIEAGEAMRRRQRLAEQ